MAQNGPARVALVKTGDRAAGVGRSIEVLGHNPVAGKKVVLKPNFNSADPTPGSTHNDTLRALIGQLWEMGAEGITIGERSGPPNTAEVMSEKGIPQLASQLGVGLVNFDELPPAELVHVNPPGSHWKAGFQVPRILQDAECVVITPCLKTHAYGGVFTLALKMAVGITPKEGNEYMREMHGSPHIRKMIAELNWGYTPDLIVLDGVEAFVEGGPMVGTRRRADVFLAGTDRVAVDAVGLAVLKELGTTPEIMDRAIFQQEQIVRAVELGLGVASPGDIELVTGDPESESYGRRIRDILDQG